MGPGVGLGRYFGIEVSAHWSLLVIFALVTVSLGGGVFPQWHPDWSPALIWGTAFAAAVLFFLSVALHELSHGLVGRWQGVPISRITLFLFGGMAHMNREPPSPRAELLMAAAGPLASFIIGLVAITTGSLLLAEQPLDSPEDAAAALASAGPAATLLLWLGPINLILAVFNMVPGFPLDGGRVLRAGLWWATGDLRRATRWAAAIGQGFAWVLIGTGVLMLLNQEVPIFGRGAASGLWLILIGWFLLSAARASYQQLLLREALDDVPVRSLMRSNIATVPPQMAVNDLVNNYIMRVDQRAFPVVENGQLLGLVCLEDVRRVPRADWNQMTSANIMTPVDRLFTVRPDDPAMEALMSLGAEAVDQLPVVEDGTLAGMVRREDIMKWLVLQDERRQYR